MWCDKHSGEQKSFVFKDQESGDVSVCQSHKRSMLKHG